MHCVSTVSIYSSFFLGAAAFLAGAFFTVGLSAAAATAALGALAFFAASIAGAIDASLCGLDLPYEPLNLFPLAVLLSPLPMFVNFFSAANVMVFERCERGE